MYIENIQNKIYEIRNHKIMFDFDLADLYEVETRILNQAIKRNIDLFPNDFMFKLTLDGMGKFVSTVGDDIKSQDSKISKSLCFYRAWSCYVGKYFEKQKSKTDQCCNYPFVY